MIWQLILLAVASVAASVVLMPHQRLLTLLATAGVMWEAHVMFLTWVERLVFAQLSAESVFTAGAIIVLVGWGVLAWSRKSRKALERHGTRGKRDAVVLAVMAIVLLAAWLIAARNQYGLEWVTHGFYNGDVATFTALTQRAMETGELVRENPLAGNGPLEYPSLLHASVANVLSAFSTGHDWLYFLSFMTFAQIALTVPMFFLLWSTMRPQETRGWAWLVPAGLALYVMALSWESFVYPQSHFFTTGLFLLMATLLIQTWPRKILPAAESRGKGNVVVLGVAAGIGVVLLFSNAVTGTAAVAMKFLYDAMQAARPKISQLERLGWAVGAMFWVVMFLMFTPGEGSLGIVPGFSYTAAVELGRLALPVLIMFIGALLMFERHLFPSLLTVVLALLAFVTFAFSSREIVVENASRFFYHAILVGWPLMIYPLTRVWYWMKLTFIDSTRTIWEQAIGWGAAVVLIGLALVPAAASVASAHDNLMFKDEQRVTTGMREALWWIADNTEPTAVFLTQLEPPFAVPVYTGRTQLRSDIWLSPGDRVQEDVKAAFEGSVAAQETVLTQADYLLLTRGQREMWEPLPLKKVFDINSVVIYQLR